MFLPLSLEDFGETSSAQSSLFRGARERPHASVRLMDVALLSALLFYVSTTLAFAYAERLVRSVDSVV